MKLERLALKGFTRYDEPASLDVSSLPEGLIAVCGSNGAGKSTLLDAALAVLDLEMPSRAGVLADYATQRDAYLDARYSIDGVGVFRARVNVDGVKRASDAVLELVGPDGKSTPLNDGKVSSFREARAKHFPPKELLLASAFAPQNRAGSFVTAKPSQRKDLFSALLGMKRFEQLAETAKKCMAIVEQALVRLRDRRDSLARETNDVLANQLADNANKVQAESGNAELRRLELRGQVEKLEAERQGLDAAAAAHAAAGERVKVIQLSMVDARAQLVVCDGDLQRADEALAGGRLLAMKAEREALTVVDFAESAARETQTSAVAKLDERIAGNHTLDRRAAEIRAAAAAKAELETSLVALRERETAMRKVIADAQEQIRIRAAKLRDAERAELDLAHARRQVETLQSVPCGGQGDFAGCRFLTDAKKAEASIADLEGAAAHGELLRQGIAHWTGVAENEERGLDGVTAQVEAAVTAMATHERLARFATELAATQARIESLTSEKASLAAVHESRLVEYAAQRERAKATRLAEVARLEAVCEGQRAAVGQRREAVSAQLLELDQALNLANEQSVRTHAEAQRRDVLESELSALRRAVTENEALLAGLAVVRTQVDKDRAAFRLKKGELVAIERRIGLVQNELLIWQTFVQCFGRDGLPTLEIDAAGPTISNLVNDLLSACFGTRFTLEFVTQEPKADNKGFKESFEIKCFDNQDGGEARDIADLSGGERVIVEEALRAAIALYVNARNVSPVRSVFRDETTGALDDENAIRYVAMLRRMQQLGGIAHVIFVSHNPDVTAMADAQVWVQDGKLDVRLPPYREVA